jgi:DNA-binding MarR family transcriptional regulator
MELRHPEDNTAALIGEVYQLLGDRIVAGVQAAGHPIRASHSAVFIHMDLDGIRLSHLAAKATMTAQAMGELVDDLQRLGYLERLPDPTDGRAKLIRLTESGIAALQSAFDTIATIEDDLSRLLGRRRLVDLRATLREVLSPAPVS